MDILAIINNLVANVTALKEQIDALQGQLIDAQSELDKVAKENYDKGFEEGKASVVVDVPVSDKIYSQADVEQMLADAMAPLKVENEALKLEMAALRAELDQKIADALNGFKAEILAKYEEMQVIESQAETGFAELLKPAVVVVEEPAPIEEPLPDAQA